MNRTITMSFRETKESKNTKGKTNTKKSNFSYNGSDIRCIIEEKSSGQAWQLTWPIWHLLPLAEKKRISADYGMSVGQFEEFASLQQAMGRSLRTEKVLTAASSREEAHETQIVEEEEEDEETDSKPTNFQESEQVPNTTSPATKTTQKKNPSLLVQMIPEELIHKVLSFLSVDCYLTTWSILCKSFCDLSNNELTFKIICQRIYTQQTKSKKLDLKRYNSYRTMYMNRPRVRTGGGIYVLKYSQIKRIQRDMWTEVP